MAWRWKALLASKGIHEPLSWLTKLYFVGYAAGQVLPTSIGGDTVRIAAHARRRPEAKAEVAGAVLMERVVGSAGTLVLVAIGLVLAVGRYNNIQEVLILEIALSVGLASHSRSCSRGGRTRGCRTGAAPGASRAGSEASGRRCTAIGRSRARSSSSSARPSSSSSSASSRSGSAAKRSGSTSPRSSTSSWARSSSSSCSSRSRSTGSGVREAFFIAFLGRFGVDADAAFATGFLFYAVTVAASIPGGAIMIWDSLRPALMRPREG